MYNPLVTWHIDQLDRKKTRRPVVQSTYEHMYSHHIYLSTIIMHQPGMVANSAHGQLKKRESVVFLVPGRA